MYETSETAMSSAGVDFGRIVGALVAHDVRFVLIGGTAALAQGAAVPTDDVDVAPEHSVANLTRLSAALAELGATRRDPVAEGLPVDRDAESLGAARGWNLTTAYGDLDIVFVPEGTEGYPDLDRDANEIEIFGAVLRVASLAAIIRSKQATNRPKDQLVLPALRKVLSGRILDMK